MSEALSARPDTGIQLQYDTPHTGAFGIDEPWYLKALDIASLPARGLVNAFTLPVTTTEHALASPAPMLDPEIRRDVTSTALDVGMAGMGAERPVGSLGMFGGQKSATASASGLTRAQSLDALGASSADIWTKTGWNKGPGGDWRYEIPDEKAQLKNWPYQGSVPRLGEILDHKALFDAYPALKDTVIHNLSVADVAKQTRGYYDPDTGVIGLGEHDALQSLLHEVQHKVQHIEGFPRGGNPAEFLPENFDAHYNDAYTKMMTYSQDLIADNVSPHRLFTALGNRAPGKTLSAEDREVLQSGRSSLGGQGLEDFYMHYHNWDQLRGIKDSALDKYMATAGEVESRMVEGRQKWSPLARATTPPEYMEGYPPPSTQHVMRNEPPKYHFPPHFSLEPVDHDPFQK